MKNLTPMMEQYYELKRQFPKEIVFFRLGDFYEMFDHDAIIASKILNIALTQRSKIKMCGIPYHTKNNYIQRLLDKGYKIVICEQVKDEYEEAQENQKSKRKGIFKREVQEVISPGTVIEENILNLSSYQKNIFVFSFDYQWDNRKKIFIYGFSYIDITTGEFFVSNNLRDTNLDSLFDELIRIHPRELVVPSYIENEKNWQGFLKYHNLNCLINYMGEEYFESDYSINFLKNFFKIESLQGFGFPISEKGSSFFLNAAGALITYIQNNNKKNLQHVSRVYSLNKDSFLKMSKQTMKHLELVENQEDQTEKNTFYEILKEGVQTSMGKRLLYRWILEPSLNLKTILKRQKHVQYFYHDFSFIQKIQKGLSKIHDIERISSRIALAKVSELDLNRLKNSLKEFLTIKSYIPSEILYDFEILKTKTQEIIHLIDIRIEDHLESDSGLIKKGFSSLLDEKKKKNEEKENALLRLQEKEALKLNWPGLKIKYNKQAGYFIEISKNKKIEIPNYYIKKQNLLQSTRYTFTDLNTYELEILNLNDEIKDLEKKYFDELIQDLLKYIYSIQKISKNIAYLDLVIAFARQAIQYRYICPKIKQEGNLFIEEGRHPIIERLFKDKKYISNSLVMDKKNSFIHLITGPNMSGKSTFLRQNCLLILMAQMGSFIPAKSAEIPIINQIFTRIGAMDFITRGESTFFVEMIETASILNRLKPGAFIIMDEIGRGTSTYDGIAIAFSILEFLAKNYNKKIYLLFSTHYYELTELARLRGIENFHLQIEKNKDEILFLHKIKAGYHQKSYGIHVAKLAGLPKPIIEKANHVLEKLEQKSISKKNSFKTDRHENENLLPFDFT